MFLRISELIHLIARDLRKRKEESDWIGLFLMNGFFSLTGTPIDLIVYDIQRISITPEYTQPVVARTTIRYKGKSIE